MQPHRLQHSRLPCPSLFPGVCSNSCPLSQWRHLIISPLPPSSLFAFNLSQHQGLLQWVGSSHSFSISPSNEYLGLISCKIDWFNLLSVQETLKNLLQHHNLKHQFFSAQPSLQVILHLHSYKYSRKNLISIKKRWKVS